MRFDRGPTRSSPTLEPIRIEFYGSDGPGLRPVTDQRHGVGRTGRGGGRVVAMVVAVALAIGIAVVAVADPLERSGDRAARPESARVSEVADGSVTARPAHTWMASSERLPPAVASMLPFPGGAVPPGRYASDLLGVPIEFAISEATTLRTARPGTILLTPVGTAAHSIDSSPHVQILRVAGWDTGEEAVDRRFRGVGSIAPDDIEGWIADNDLIVDARSRMRVDGRDTRVFDVRVDPASPLGHDVCAPESRPCFWFASVAAEIIPHAAIRLDYALYSSMTMRLWLVTIPGEDPVLIEAAVPSGSELWLDEFEATTVSTMAIGETALELLVGAGSGIPAPR